MITIMSIFAAAYFPRTKQSRWCRCWRSRRKWQNSCARKASHQTSVVPQIHRFHRAAMVCHIAAAVVWIITWIVDLRSEADTRKCFSVSVSTPAGPSRNQCTIEWFRWRDIRAIGSVAAQPLQLRLMWQTICERCSINYRRCPMRHLTTFPVSDHQFRQLFPVITMAYQHEHL